MASGTGNLVEIGNEAVLLKVLCFLDQHFAVADNSVERRSQLMAHGREELALRLTCRLGLLLGGLQFGFAFLQFGNVGVDGDPSAIGCLSLGNPDPVVAIAPFVRIALRLSMARKASLHPL